MEIEESSTSKPSKRRICSSNSDDDDEQQQQRHLKMKQQKTSSNVSTYNLYAPLDDENTSNDNNDSNNNNNSANNTSTKSSHKIKIPPIIVTDCRYNEIISILKALNVVDAYSLRVMSIGIKISVNCNATHKLLCEYLSSSKRKFYTHDLSKQKKIILAGLPILDLNVLKTGLLDADIDCDNIIQMKIKNTKYADHALYLVYFSENKNINLNQLKKVKYIFHTVIRWDRYISNRGGPTQCRNCQLYGHGMRNCHLDPRCQFCGDKHLTENCPTHQSTSGASTQKSYVPKCCLCGQNHKSNYDQCPRRLEFVNMSRQLASNNKNQRYSKHFNNSPSNNFNNFPQLPRHSTVANLTQSQVLQQPSQPTHPNIKYSSWFRNETSLDTCNIQLQQQHKQQANHQQQQYVNDNSDLFSSTELINITKEVLFTLKSCKNKSDQFDAIIKLTTKYLFNHHND